MTPEQIEQLTTAIDDTEGMYVYGYVCIPAVLISTMDGELDGTEQVIELAFLGTTLTAQGETVLDEANRPVPILHRGWLSREAIPELIMKLWEAFDAANLLDMQAREADRGVPEKSGEDETQL